MTALPALSRQTGVVVLYPYQLAPVRSNPVKGLYTVPEALQLMLQGTGFSGDVTAQGAVSISRLKKRCDTEGETMLRDSKSSVSVLALLASLFSAPVCAQQVAQAGGASEGPVETVTVSGSRVITDIANSPTPITAVNTEQLLATTPTNLGGLCRRHHRLKQRRRWSYRLAPDGTVTWTSPSGTQRISEPDHAALSPPPPQDASAAAPERDLVAVEPPPF